MSVGMDRIQVNQVVGDVLEWLPGIGPATAKKIIEARPIETAAELEQIIPPSAWLKIQDAGLEFGFDADIETPAPAETEVVVVGAEPELTIVGEDAPPMTLRRVMPGGQLKTNGHYLCVWNVCWFPDGQAVGPNDANLQSQIAGRLRDRHGIVIEFAHYGASVVVEAGGAPKPLVMFEVVQEEGDGS